MIKPVRDHCRIDGVSRAGRLALSGASGTCCWSTPGRTGWRIRRPMFDHSALRAARPAREQRSASASPLAQAPDHRRVRARLPSGKTTHCPDAWRDTISRPRPASRGCWNTTFTARCLCRCCGTRRSTPVWRSRCSPPSPRSMPLQPLRGPSSPHQLAKDGRDGRPHRAPPAWLGVGDGKLVPLVRLSAA